MAYEFHYTPTGTGVISGKEVLEQTEDAINDLGNTAISGVQEALDKAEQALTNSENAVDDAQTALNTANNAEGVAIQAQTDVGNLSGTVTNIGNRVTTAEGNITNLQGRMTTAEGNVTNLQGRMTTAEGNIGNLQTAVSTAQATANSAQQTANTARQQSYVFRYSGTAVVPNSTIAYSTIDNTDNIKSGDKILDVDGKLFEITAVDTTNETVTVGSALIDLAQDSDVVHKSGNETVGGAKTFTDVITNNITNKANAYITLKNSSYDPKTNGQSNADSGSFSISFNTLTDDSFAYISAYGLPEYSMLRLTTTYFTDSENSITDSIEYKIYQNGDRSLRPRNNNNCTLGETGRRWSKIYGIEYYYGSNNEEFSTKFVTTDTNQTISGNKTFSSNVNVYNSDATANTPNLILQSSKIQLGDTTNSDSQSIIFNAGNSFVSKIDSFKDGSGTQNLQNHVRTRDASNNIISAMYRLRLFNTGLAFLESNSDNTISLGRNNAKWKDCQTYLVNGLTPSSLSLPSGNVSDVIDISSYFANTGSGDTNSYTAPANGWIYLRLGDISSCQVVLNDSSNRRLWGTSATGNVEQIMTPILKNTTLITTWVTNSTVNVASAKFIPCQGNV